ncbi:unnamed protein product [Heterobilharzia americana]|nr:unnamed protein product [Heterobilharzia americana]
MIKERFKSAHLYDTLSNTNNNSVDIIDSGVKCNYGNSCQHDLYELKKPTFMLSSLLEKPGSDCSITGTTLTATTKLTSSIGVLSSNDLNTRQTSSADSSTCIAYSQYKDKLRCPLFSKSSSGFPSPPAQCTLNRLLPCYLNSSPSLSITSNCEIMKSGSLHHHDEYYNKFLIEIY